MSNILQKLKTTHHTLRLTIEKAKKIRTNRLIQRASAMNTENKSNKAKTMLNIERIENVIQIWRINI